MRHTFIACLFLRPFRQAVSLCAALLTALLLAPLTALHAADAHKLLPPDWNPALAGDIVLQRLVKVTAPQVKGAHDAEFVCVGDRAYVVSEANDLRGGENGGWPFIYSTLSIVNPAALSCGG